MDVASAAAESDTASPTAAAAAGVTASVAGPAAAGALPPIGQSNGLGGGDDDGDGANLDDADLWSEIGSVEGLPAGVLVAGLGVAVAAPQPLLDEEADGADAVVVAMGSEDEDDDDFEVVSCPSTSPPTSPMLSALDVVTIRKPRSKPPVLVAVPEDVPPVVVTVPYSPAAGPTGRGLYAAVAGRVTATATAVRSATEPADRPAWMSEARLHQRAERLSFPGVGGATCHGPAAWDDVVDDDDESLGELVYELYKDSGGRLPRVGHRPAA